MATLDILPQRKIELEKTLQKNQEALTARQGVYLSVIIPAYNEAEVLQKTLRRLEEYFSSHPFSHEIIVVTDGPRDNTIELAERMKGEVNNLKVIGRRQNRGKGYSVREGMLAAVGKVRLFMDADNGTDISHFDLMRPLFDKGYDIVISSRNPKDVPGGKEVRQLWWRRILGNIGNRVIQLLTVPGIWDTQNGFKAFRDYAAERLFRLTRVDRWAFDVEVLALAQRLDYKIGIVPAQWINGPKSSIRLSSYFSFLWEVLKIRRNLIARKYNL